MKRTKTATKHRRKAAPRAAPARAPGADESDRAAAVLERSVEGEKLYICEQCNTEYRAHDKYELAEMVPHADFGTDIEFYEDETDHVNILRACDVCWERQDETPFEQGNIM